VQVQRLLKALQRDRDDESLHSGDGSNADSGRGVSDEGGDLHLRNTDPQSLQVGMYNCSFCISIKNISILYFNQKNIFIFEEHSC